MQRCQQASGRYSAAPAPLQQEGADLIDDVDALADQPLTDAMQRLQVELIGGLGDHELHRRSLYRLGNRLSVTEVRFWPLE